MASVAAVLKAFNGQLDLREAFNYDRDKIVFDFLSPVAKSPSDWGWPNQEELGKVRDLVERIEVLSKPDGSEFRKPKPEQHMGRAMNSDKVLQVKATRFQIPNDSSATNNRPYWALYDYLGLLLSILGPAPQGATKRNFYLPLLAVYSRWCIQFGSTQVDGKGVSSPPYAFQCTWYDKDNEDRRYLLGASIEGWTRDKDYEFFREAVQLKRYNVLVADIDMANHLAAKGYDMTNTPRAGKDKDAGSNFGNCAETYPFLYMLSTYPPGAINYNYIFGIALKKTYLGVVATEYDEDKVKPHLLAPCNNCRYLLRGFDETKFNPSFDLSKDNTIEARAAPTDVYKKKDKK